MAKLRRTPLDATDISSILAVESDFPFEMSVLARLDELGFRCQHSGTYVDPVSEKLRQFDIRARMVPAPEHHLYLSVECKNIPPFHPLVVHCVPRRDEEAFHNLLRYWPMDARADPMHLVALETIRHVGDDTLYPRGKAVGKRFDQVGRTQEKGAPPQIDDSDIFAKLSQAASASRDFIHEAGASNVRGLHAVLPILVIPDGVLWAIDYSSEGAVVAPARSVDRVPYFLGYEYPVNIGVARTFTLSHLEVITFSYLPTFAEMLRPPHPEAFPAAWKPKWALG